MNEAVNQILAHTDLFVSGLVSVVIIGGVIIEALPIPINPLKWLGNRLNKDIKEDIQKDIKGIKQDIVGLNNRLTKIEDNNLKSDLQAKRALVLSFADKLRRTPLDQLAKVCSLEEFKNIIDVMDDYHALIEEYQIPNGRFDVAREYILDVFVDLSKHGGFVDKEQFINRK